jgi:hypothetical protein
MADGKVPGAFALGATYAVRVGAFERALEAGLVGQRSEPDNGNRAFLTSYETRDRLHGAGIRIAHATVLRWLQKGVLPGEKVGRSWAVPKKRLREMLDEGFEVPSRGRPPNAS